VIEMTFNIREFIKLMQPVIKNALEELDSLGIKNATYLSLPNDEEKERIYLSIPADEFPWNADGVEVWGINTWGREARGSLDLKYVRLGTDLKFDDTATLAKLPSFIKLNIRNEIHEDIKRQLKDYKGERREWKKQDPRIKQMQKDIENLR